MNQDNYSIKAWKLIFIVLGCVTMFLGFLIAAHLPDTPAKAWFLNEQERALVVERIRKNQQGFGNKHFKKYQFIEAISDYKTWLLFLFGVSTNIPSSGMTAFGSILLNETMGYSVTQSLLMGMPSGAVELVGCLGLAYISTITHSRMFLAFIGTGIVVLAQCLLAFGTLQAVQMAGYNLYAFVPIGLICMVSVVASNVAGHTKKITSNAILFMGYCVGSLVGPQTFVAKQAPQYHGAKVAILTCGIISWFTIAAVWYGYVRENKKKDLINKEDFPSFENHEFADLTDKENIYFRYQT